MRHLLVIIALVGAPALADPAPIPPELKGVKIEHPESVDAYKVWGTATVGGAKLIAFEEDSSRDTNRCCDIPPGDDERILVADVATGEIRLDVDGGSQNGLLPKYVESAYRYRPAWKDLDGDGSAELVFTLIQRENEDAAQERVYQLRYGSLVQVSRAQVKACPTPTASDPRAALAAASPAQLGCALADVYQDPTSVPSVVVATPWACPAFEWASRNGGDSPAPAFPAHYFAVVDGKIDAALDGGYEDVFKPVKGRVVGLQLLANGDRPWLAAELDSRHLLVVDSSSGNVAIDEPLQHGESITVDDQARAVSVGVRGKARKTFTYDPANDFWR
jgi:hypothetical protein